jgi:hypothetical protein
MNTEIENLINMALADGEVTEKERGIILRKAEALGLDQDEVEMILDGKIEIQKKELSHSQSSKENTSNKAGDIKKCPSCGAPVESFNTKCAECGHEFRGIEASKTISTLFEKLDSIEKERDTIKLGGLAGLLGGLDEASKHMQIDEIITRKKAALIRNFPIPNTREELLELLHFIHPKINNKASSDNNFNDWKARFNEIIGRAKFAYKNDKSMLAELQLYENTAKGSIFSYFNQMDKKKKASFFVLGFFVLFIGLMIPFFSGMSSDHDKGVEKEKVRLELIMNKVNEAISKKDLESALMLSAQLKWEYSDSYSSTDTKQLIIAWDEKREKLIEIINNEKETKSK